MTKAALVDILVRTSGESRASAERAMRALLAAVAESLRQGKPVTITGFGTFVVSRRAGRNGRNPRTGKAITIPPARVPRFRASRTLKTSVR